MKRLKTLFLLSLLSIGAWAQGSFVTEGFYYRYIQDANGNSALEVTGLATNAENIVIPDKIQEYNIIKIGYGAFKDNNTIKTVKLPANCIEIDKEAFKGCGNLETIDFGKSLVTIGDHAFYLNRKLRTVSLPNTVKTIGEKAFWTCDGMTDVNLGNSVETIGSYAFQYCKKMEHISLPNTLQEVGDHFLCACEGLKKVVIPEKLVKIGEYFLHGCHNMREVYLVGPAKRTLGKYPFVSQIQQKQQQVHDCVFYVESQEVYEQNYKTTDNWKYADENNHDEIGDNIDGKYTNGGNYYTWKKPDDIIPYKASWVTACYPTEINATEEFGNGALVAEMVNAHYNGKDGKGNYLYRIDFKVMTGEQIMKANTPYLLKVDPQSVGSAYIVKHSENEETTSDMQLTKEVNIDNQADDPSATKTMIRMLGTYTKGGRNLNHGEIIFVNNNGKLKFYKQSKNTDKQRHMGTYKCYWQIVKDGVVATDAKMYAMADDVTAIQTVEAEIHVHYKNREEVFNLKGQVVGNAQSLQSLPNGIYIVNGKKVVKK
ncbi:leucine-rich repeat domain-containing protein [Prevotella falsenii]|uniref:leucine-rich repeat domain-containing protein n=1 Tax=Prevotella falsenii TaxID=515414 RepID=UPI0012EB1BAB|nr:leucine-rich repeat domain-containing protein [Prevotella falsenii]